MCSLFLVICASYAATPTASDAVTNPVDVLLHKYSHNLEEPIKAFFCQPEDGVTSSILASMGPNILDALAAALDSPERFAGANTASQYMFVDLFEQVSAFMPCFCNGDGTIESLHGATSCKPISQTLPWLRWNVPGDTQVTVAPLFTKWWRERDSFPDCAELVRRIRAITGNSESQYEHYDACVAVELSIQVFPYGVFSIPAFIEVIAEDDNLCMFQEFLRLYLAGTSHSLCRTSDCRECLTLVRKIFPSRVERLCFIRNWWHETKDGFSALKRLYSNIEEQIDRFCPKDTLPTWSPHMEHLPLMGMVIPELSDRPSVMSLEKGQNAASVEAQIGCHGVRLDASNAPGIFGHSFSGYVLLWRWEGTNGLSNYLEMSMNSENRLEGFSFSYGCMPIGLTKDLLATQ